MKYFSEKNMKLKNLILLSALVTLFTMFLGIQSTYAATWYVDAQYGLDGYTGTAAVPAAANVGPKQSITNALSAAADGDIIIIAPRGAGSVYSFEPANLITITNKTITFKILADPSTGFSGTPRLGDANIDADFVLDDASANPTGVTFDANGTSYKFQFSTGRNFTLNRGSVTGGANLAFAGISTIKRLRSSTIFDATPSYLIADAITLQYGDDPTASNITVGPEWTTATDRIAAVVNLQTVGSVILGASRTAGNLTNSAGGTGINIGSNTLTLYGNTHSNTNNITSTSVSAGKIVFTHAGGTITWAGIGNIPSIQKSGTSILNVTTATTIHGSVTVDAVAGAVTLSLVTTIDAGIAHAGTGLFTVTPGVSVGALGTYSIVSSGSGGMTFSAALSDGAGTTSITNSGTGNVTVSGALDIGGDITNSGTITGAVTAIKGARMSFAAVTFVRNIYNQGSVSAVTGAFNAGNIDFSGIITSAGAVTNSTTVTNVVAGQLYGNITFGAAVTAMGIVTNAGTITNNSAAALIMSACGNINFNAASTVASVINNKTVTSSSVTLIINQITNCGNILFADAAQTVHGAVDLTSTVSATESAATAGNADFDVLTNSGNIVFASTVVGSAIQIDGRVYNNSTHSRALSGTTLTGNGVLTASARVAAPIQIGLALTPSSVQNLSTGTVATNGILALSGGAATGTITIYGPVSATGTGSGTTTLNAFQDNLAVTGTLTLDPASGARTITTGGTGTVGITGAILRGVNGTNASDITFASSGAYTLGGTITNNATTSGTNIDFTSATAPVTVTGLVKNAAAGSITFAGTAVIATLTAGLESSGAGSVTFANTTGLITLGSLTVTNGTVSFAAVNAAVAVTDNGNFTHTGGNITFGAAANFFDVLGATTTLGTGASYTASAATTIRYVGTVAQAVTIQGGGTRTWPGNLQVNNSYSVGLPAVGTNAWTLNGGNYYITGDVDFTDGQVVINGVYLFVNGDFNYDNALNEAYVTNTVGAQPGFLSMKSEAGVAAVVDLTTNNITFGNFEVDHATGVNFTAGNTYVMTGLVNLTRGPVSGTGATATIDFNGSPFPTIVRNAGSFVIGGGPDLALTYTTPVNLQYINSGAGSMVMGTEVPAAAHRLNNVSVTSVGSATGITAAGAMTIMGKLEVATTKIFNTGGFVITLGDNAAFAGSSPSALNLLGTADVAGAGSFLLAATAGTAITGAGLAGDGNTITAGLTLATGSAATVTGIQYIDGDVVTSAGDGTLGLAFVNPSSSTDFSNLRKDLTTDDAFTGTVSINSRVQLLGSTAGNSVLTHNGGTIALGNNNLVLRGTAAVTHVFDGNDAIVTSTGGVLELQGVTGQQITVNNADVTIPYFTVNLAAKVNTLGISTNDIIVSNTFNGTMGTLNEVGGAPTEFVVVTGSTANISTNCVFGTAGLELAPAGVAPSTLTAKIDNAGLFAVQQLVVGGTDGNTVLLASNGTASGIEVSTSFVHNNAVLFNFGSKELRLTGATFTLSGAGTYAASTTAPLGYLTFNGGVTVDQGAGFSVPNLRFTLLASTFTGSGAVTVTNTLDINNTDNTVTNLITTGGLTVNNGVTVNWTNGKFDVNPNYINMITLNANGYTNNQILDATVWPASDGLVGILNINGTNAADKVLLPGSRVINTALNLNKGVLDLNFSVLAFVTGTSTTRNDLSAINPNGGSVIFPGDNMYDVTYKTLHSTAGTGNIATGLELAGSLNNLTVTRGANVANALLTINTPVYVYGTLTIRNNVTSAAGQYAFVNAKGNVVVGLDPYTFATMPVITMDPTGPFVLGGVNGQTLTIPSNQTLKIDYLTVDLAGINPVLQVPTGNLSVNTDNASLLTFNNGIIKMGAGQLNLARPKLALNSGLGFDRSAVEMDPSKVGHVVGNVARPGGQNDGTANDGRFVFPTGTDPVDGTPHYRPIIFTFTPTYALGSPTTFVVSHVNSDPQGTVGFVLDGGITAGTAIKIGRYPNFYWSVYSYPAGLSQTQNYDVEMQGDNLGYPYISHTFLRGIRRLGTVVTNSWYCLQTDGETNLELSNPSGVLVRSTATQGGIVQNASRFTIGIPVQGPTFTTPAVSPYVVPVSTPEKTAISIPFAVKSNVLGVSVPTIESITINPVPVADPSSTAWSTAATVVTTTSGQTRSGNFTWTPGYLHAGTYTVTINAKDGDNGTASQEITFTVTNLNQAPAVATVTSSTTSPKVLQSYTVQFTTSDQDPGDVITWTPQASVITLSGAPSTFNGTITASAPLTGNTFTYTIAPTLADLNKVVSVSVKYTDGTFEQTATYTFANAIGVGYWGAILTNGGAQVTTGDAFEALRMSVGFSGPAAGGTYTALQTLLANVDGNPGVTAYDAYLILYKFTHPAWLFPVEGGVTPPSKAGSVAGELSVGKATASANNMISIPLTLDRASNVNAITFDLKFDATMAEVKNVTSNLPEDWVTTFKADKSGVKVVMIGATPININKLGELNLMLKSKEAKVQISGNTIINNLESRTIAAVTVGQIPANFELSQNYPNPFNPSTTIKYGVSEPTRVRLSIYNIEGQLVSTLVNETQEAGFYSVNWNGRNDFGQQLASGMYIYRIDAGNFVATKKLMLMK